MTINTKEPYALLKSAVPGKNLLVCVAIHGNELCGLRAVERVLPSLTLIRGSLTVIVGNPRAMERGVRYVDTNLNRLFRRDDQVSESLRTTYEYQRSRELMPYITAADAVLDIHSSGTPGAPPFVIANAYGLPKAELLGFPLVSYGWGEVEPGGTEDYAEKLGISAYCVECGYHNDESAIARAEDALLRFCQMNGIIEGVPNAVQPRARVEVASAYVAKSNFVPARIFADFEKVQAGEVIGTDGGMSVVAPDDGVVLFVRARDASRDEAFVFGVER